MYFIVEVSNKYFLLYLDSWNETSYYYEQPSVEFEDQLIIYKTEKERDNYVDRFFSSILPVNKANSDRLFKNIPLIKYSFFDDNNDGLKDRFKFKITFYPDDMNNLKNIKLAFLFKYEVRTNVVGRMNTVAMVDIDTPLGASYIKVDGNLNLMQKSSMDRTTFYNEYYYRNIFNNTNGEYLSFDEIANEYYSRNFSTYYDYDTYIIPMKNPKVVKIEVNINIPSFQKILFTTPLFTKIKFFWLQYFSVLIPIAAIFYFIMQFVFRNHIVDTINSNDIGVKKKKIL